MKKTKDNFSDEFLENDDLDIERLDMQKMISTVAAGKFLNSLIWALTLVAIVVIVAVVFG